MYNACTIRFHSLLLVICCLFIIYFCLNANIEKTEIIIEIKLVSLPLDLIYKCFVNERISITRIECYARTQ